MKIKVCRKNITKMQKVLDRANGDRKDRALFVQDVFLLEGRLRGWLDHHHVPYSKRRDCIVAFSKMVTDKSHGFYHTTLISVCVGANGKDIFLIQAKDTFYFPDPLSRPFRFYLTPVLEEFIRETALQRFYDTF